MQVAAIQMVSTGVVQDNLAQAAKLLEQAAQAGAELRVVDCGRHLAFVHQRGGR